MFPPLIKPPPDASSSPKQPLTPKLLLRNQKNTSSSKKLAETPQDDGSSVNFFAGSSMWPAATALGKTVGGSSRRLLPNNSKANVSGKHLVSLSPPSLPKKTLAVPTSPLAKRPTSAPYQSNGEYLEEAQINAAFLGNSLKAKKQIQQKKPVEEGSGLRAFTLQDFEIKEQIGKGAFARVHVIKFKNSQDESQCLHSNGSVNARTYAIKSLRKADIVKTKQIKHVTSEKNILAMLRSPFVVDLITTFQDRKHLYLVLEYIPGGDMFSHIRKHVRFSEPIARFYTVEIILALEYIHSKDVIYRDLKPENILIDVRGHIKIADFGFAKVVPRNHAVTFCGTPAYMAPEIILKLGYSRVVDWWSLGVVCYELMAGYSPFQAETPLKIYERILNSDMRWSSQIHEVARDLLSRILEIQANKRLGVNGAREIKEHSWFCGVDWGAAAQLAVPVPFVPAVAGDGDVGNFDVYTDASSVIGMQRGTISVTSEDEQFEGLFPDF
ncbi:camp-dependent protein kinase catalytic subunit [Entophlyctis luteolus]|nr:camp-dependent protein kinase catalytic subunit [Entophlyctis luteolus]